VRRASLKRRLYVVVELRLPMQRAMNTVKDNDKVLVGAFPGAQPFVLGSAVNVQFMVTDLKKYAAAGGSGFGDFKD
jgi:hypothetical protein